MPGLDGTGPRGEGPATGGGFGYCTGYIPKGEKKDYIQRPLYGRGLNRGRGRGHRNVFYETGKTFVQRNLEKKPSDLEKKVNE